MSLDVSVYYRDELTGDRKEVPLRYSYFGGESTRKTLWGAAILRQLGLKLLPELGNGAWLNIEGPELDQLEQEAHIILDNLELIAQRTQYEHTWMFGEYMRNLLNAIAKAREINGGVSI